jgi:hypothetical protein
MPLKKNPGRKSMENFTQLMPEIAQLKPLVKSGETICWDAYNKAGKLLGYAFSVDCPEMVAGLGDDQEMDKYRIFGIVDPKEYKIIAIDITIHPEGPAEPWALEIAEPKFEKQYLGLTVKEIELSPDGKIDAITDSTMSSNFVTQAIHEKVQNIIKQKVG